MSTRHATPTLLFNGVLLLTFVAVLNAAAKNEMPARLLAQQTGATQFEEERFEPHTDCNDHKHRLKKRSSDEDIDYEVYQGVVGRPGIDFPIYPRIPRTSFSCRSFGNGYFADMETDCQVFHICEEGRKISFLCPNGTIFQQSELTCDWWFKVNCLGSPGYYAESAEILNKQRLQRVRPSVPVQGFNIVGGGLNIKPRVSNGGRQSSRTSGKKERPIDSNEQPSLENVDFDDLSSEKQLKGLQAKVISNIDNNNNDNDESQVTAESASFVSGNRRNIYAYNKPQSEEEPKRGEGRNNGRNSLVASKRGNNGARYSYRNPSETQNHKELKEKARNTQRGRGQQRYREDDSSTEPHGPFEHGSSEESKVPKKVASSEKRLKPVVPAEGRAKFSSVEDIKAEVESTQPTSVRTSSRTQNTTPSLLAGTYSTTRRLDGTKSTPFYTPTVPSISKSKATEGKKHYVKGQGNNDAVEVTDLTNSFGDRKGLTGTTPTPSRLSNKAEDSLVLNSPATDFADFNKISATSTTSSTLRPFVIGMRHNYDDSSEIHRIALTSNNRFNIDLVTNKAKKRFEGPDYLPTIAPTFKSTGPTYLPKSAIRPKAPVDAGGDLLLFAPNPVADENVARNVDDMLKTMNLLRENLNTSEEDDDDEDAVGAKKPIPGREGLDIPPSSGPDVLISLAKYFAGEQNDSSAGASNTLNNAKSDKPSKSSGSAGVLAPNTKPSDTTATLTTAATPGVSVKGDNIRFGLLSEKTVDKYSSLFGLKDAKGRKQDADLSVGLLSNVNDNNFSRNKETSSPFPQIGTTDSTIRQLAEKPESRKIAQVFSNALTTYLDDPKSFREQLASVRPTEPPVRGRTESALFNHGTAASYLPTRPTPAAEGTTTQRSIASEINNKFDYSTQTPDVVSTTEFLDTTTYRPPHDFLQKLKTDLSSDLATTNQESGETDELLQRQQTQSFVKSRNELNSGRDRTKQSQKVGTAKPTENPWTHISQTDFLDPLTINTGLMKESTTTPSSHTYLPKVTTTPLPPVTTVAYKGRGKTQVLSSVSQRLQTTQGGHTLVGSAEVTTPRNALALNSQESADFSWQDIFGNYDLPRESLPSNSGLQRIANKLFGGLNETEALHLKNVMLQAEHNRQVLGLLLLLIQTCDDQNGRALERSRKHLLNALIDMDGKVEPQQQGGRGKLTHQKAGAAQATTTRVPVTTYRRQNDDVGGASTTLLPITTELPFTTTVFPTLQPGGGSVEETTKFEIRVAEPEEETATHANAHSDANSDQRALELLKSLYSLASKFSSRR